jgi:cytochrome c5
MSSRDVSLASRARPRPHAVRRTLAAALVLTTLIIATLSPGAGGPAVPARGAAYPSVFPAGPGQAIAERACLFCHSPMLVTQQAKDSTGWEKSIAQMEKWGAPLERAEQDSLRNYLLTHFGPRGGTK